MIEAIKILWCRRFHHGVINMTSLTYECPQCFRLTYHGLNQGFKAFPNPQTETDNVSIKTPRRQRQKVRSIA